MLFPVRPRTRVRFPPPPSFPPDRPCLWAYGGNGLYESPSRAFEDLARPLRRERLPFVLSSIRSSRLAEITDADLLSQKTAEAVRVGCDVGAAELSSGRVGEDVRSLGRLGDEANQVGRPCGSLKAPALEVCVRLGLAGSVLVQHQRRVDLGVDAARGRNQRGRGARIPRALGP